ncbi:chromatin modification- protein VID21, partial [Ascosphaera aggregata]
MLRDDRLRSKKDDLARVISSRKRKLSELYYATVHFPLAATDKGDDNHHHRHRYDQHGDDNSSLASYRQKELQFLDANDITRGRFFDESTLPPQLALTAVRLAVQSVVAEASQVSRGQTVVDDGTKSAPYSQVPESATLSAKHLSSSNPSISLTVSRPQSPDVSTLPSTSTSQARTSHVPLRVDASLSIQDVSVKQHSSPISEVSPNVVDQHPTSPSSSVTSITAHTAAASPSKDALFAEPKQPTPQPRVSEPFPQPSAAAIASDKQVSAKSGIITDVQGREQPLLSPKRETIEADAQTELARIAPHSATAENSGAAAAASPAVAQAPSTPTPSDQTPPQPSTPQAAKLQGPSLGRRAISPTRPLERMTTRVSSGAIRHKSVSEILGEKPKAQVLGATKELRELKENAIGSPRWRTNEKQKKEKERSKLSTVIFPKQSPRKGRYQGFPPRHQFANRADGATVASQHGFTSQEETANEENDYLFTLFQAKAHLPPRSIHLNILLSTAHKVLTTSDHLVDYNEQMSCRILKRLYQLQSANRWPLRQLQRAREPKRQPCHWDVLIDHAKWMSTDFKEERKWKIAVAKACAEWCKHYYQASPVEKAALRVNAHIPPPFTRLTQSAISSTMQLSEMDASPHPTPDLISSHEEDSIRDDTSEDPHPDMSDGLVPAAVFSLGCDKFTFNMERTAASDAILGELPLYLPVQMNSKEEAPLFQELPDSEWQTEILPVTKFAQGKLDLPPRGPPKKKSRYQYYDSDDEDEDNDTDRPSIPPERSGSALFDCEKVSTGGAFRSPMEFPLPRQEFFDERVSSVWTPAEDEKLRSLVKEYSYNWSLVASCLAHRSSQGWASPQCSSRTSSNFVSAAERRTPWECFERWTSLEPLPVDVARHPAYIKYRGMIDRSQQRISTAQQMAIQQHQAAGQPIPQSLLRRKTNLPVSVEQRYSTRHISSLDAIRKLVKKREAIAQKQQHTTQVASQRKINELCQPKPPLKTPQEWARLKQERDAKLHEQYKQTALAQQRAVMAQRLHAHSQQPHHQQLAQHAAAQIYQQQHGVLDQHGVPGIPIPL